MITNPIDVILMKLQGRLVTNRVSQQSYAWRNMLMEAALSEARADSYENAICEILSFKRELYRGDTAVQKEIDEYWDTVKNGEFLKKVRKNSAEKVEAANRFYGGRYSDAEGFQKLDRVSAYPQEFLEKLNERTFVPVAQCPHSERRNGICTRCYHDENFRETSGRLAQALMCQAIYNKRGCILPNKHFGPHQTHSLIEWPNI